MSNILGPYYQGQVSTLIECKGINSQIEGKNAGSKINYAIKDKIDTKIKIYFLWFF